MYDTVEPNTARSQLAATFSLSNDRLFWVAALLAIAPLWFGSYLPMVDLPQHAGQITALREIWKGNPVFTQAFEINWFTPYLFGYLLLYAISLLMPVTAAAQLLISFAVLSVPLLTARLLRSAGADERWKWLAIPGSYSFAFYWGFVSYMVAVPLALMFLIHGFHYARQPSRAGAWLVAMLSIFLFFCHVIALCFASLLAVGYLAATRYHDPKRCALLALPYAVPLPLIVGWLAITSAREATVQNAPIVYGSVLDRFAALVMQPAGMDRLTTVSIVVTAAVVLLPFLSGARFSRHPERWIPLVLGMLVFLLAPSYAFNTGFLYERLGIFLVPLWLMAWDRPTGSLRPVSAVAMAVVILWILANIARFAAFARETQHFNKAIAGLERGARIASMPFDPTTALFAAPIYLHFSAWYQATRAGIVDFNFADFHPQMVRYRSPQGGRINEVMAWYPVTFEWSRDGGPSYDYFIVKANADVARKLFKEKVAAVMLTNRSGWWWVYKNTERLRMSPITARDLPPRH